MMLEFAPGAAAIYRDAAPSPSLVRAIDMRNLWKRKTFKVTPYPGQNSSQPYPPLLDYQYASAKLSRMPDVGERSSLDASGRDILISTALSLVLDRLTTLTALMHLRGMMRTTWLLRTGKRTLRVCSKDNVRTRQWRKTTRNRTATYRQ